MIEKDLDFYNISLERDEKYTFSIIYFDSMLWESAFRGYTKRNSKVIKRIKSIEKENTIMDI
jgi:hypothetical protein